MFTLLHESSTHGHIGEDITNETQLALEQIQSRKKTNLRQIRK